MLVQRRLITARDAARQARLKEIEAVKMTLPQRRVPDADHRRLTCRTISSKRCKPFENVGEIMLRFLIDENRVRRALNDCPPDAFRRLQDALDKLVIPEIEAPKAPETR